MEYFTQILVLLGIAVTIIVVFQRLHIPTSLGYLFVGLIVGPFTIGPVLDGQQIRALAEFGIVFLLFTIGLNFSLPQIRTLGNRVLGLGTGQVVLTTVLVGVIGVMAGLPVAEAFIVGAVFAQSSTTVISKQLAEQGEEKGRHGRLGTAMSVFQDVSAVPLVVIVPALGAAAGASALGTSLGLAVGKALLAFALVFFLGRRLLRPFFHLVAERRSAELFTLTVLFVSLLAAWTTNKLGLSMAFGGFLAGMVLGETEFRHQVEGTIRPFRDVLIGLFFVGIGMLFDPATLPYLWHWALLGATLLMVSKILIVSLLVRWSGVDSFTAWRTGLLLAVGGEFGFALLAIALIAEAIDPQLGQIVLTSVLFSIILAPFLIRYNHVIARLFASWPARKPDPQVPRVDTDPVGPLGEHVILCGFGRIGQSVGHLLEEEKIPFIALDLDASRVREAHLAGEHVFYGDSANREVLKAVGVRSARLLVITHEDFAAASETLRHVRGLHPDLPVMVRTRDETHVEELRAAGATEVVPETLEAGLMIASQALLLLDVPLRRVMRRMQQQRSERYRLLREHFRGDAIAEIDGDSHADRLRVVQVAQESAAAGRALVEINLDGVVVTALVRDGERQLSPSLETCLQTGDAVVLFGSPDDLERAMRNLLG
jgi:monovalent cation:H+ antiporter-2, CPA2 family